MYALTALQHPAVAAAVNTPALLRDLAYGLGSPLHLVLPTGSTCLESDMLTWRKIGFWRRVVPGDHLVYLNTAGYQMDSNESPFHEVDLPVKVVLRLGDGHDRPRWHLDTLPSPRENDDRRDAPA